MKAKTNSMMQKMNDKEIWKTNEGVVALRVLFHDFHNITVVSDPRFI